LGQIEDMPAGAHLPYDAKCYLCPGNERAAGKKNPKYSGPYAFDNDFPALSADVKPVQSKESLFNSRAESGRCRVVCFSERHDRHLSSMSVREVTDVLQFVANECRELDQNPDIRYVQAFENRGAMMGCSNPHPHAQIWATSTVPTEAEKELHSQSTYWQTHGRSLLLDYISAEVTYGSRLIATNANAVSLVPFWATWPFEALLVPRQMTGTLHDIDAPELRGFAEVLHQTLAAYDRLFGVPMPYSMGFHPRPSDGNTHPEWQFHVHIYPPLLRSATIRKHMVGFELMAMPQRDLTPESAAEQIRSALHGRQ
jgi:UDPglucose--hexose-1-phosphate uridylyltransferase